MYERTSIDRLFSLMPTIKSLLRDAPNPKNARRFLIPYLDELNRFLHHSTSTGDNLEWSLQVSCVQVIRRMISMRSEHLTHFSLVKVLWELANERFENLPEDLSEAFFADLFHLFKGASGKSEVYEDLEFPNLPDLKGREAALKRSDRLDELSEKVRGSMKKYRSGLEPEIISRREANRRRIFTVLSISEKEWNDPAWQMANIIRNSDTLGRLIQLTDEERTCITQARQAGLPFGITPYYVSLMDEEPSRENDHAVRAQVIPGPIYVEKMRKNRESKSHSFDFMMENDTSPIDLVTRRYPRIAILKPYNTCSQICVYCQRNWEIDDVLAPGALAPAEKISEAIAWLEAHPAISEVLITGGDPLVLSPQQLRPILEAVAAIDHVERIRIGSRIPVTMPMKITDETVDLIAEFHVPGRREMVLVTHFEHPFEVTPEAMEAVQKFRRRGMSVYNQTVFTVENSRRFEVAALRHLLRLIGVDPYYTFNTKGKDETSRYRVPMARLQQEVREEARLSPGMARTDEPVYNVPGLGKNYLRAEQNHLLLSILPNGSRVYEFHPWEKFAANVKTYIDKDVPIFDYLQELERRGESSEDYKTIYYYF
jgi:lysine 2,3-aminomutase